MANIISSVDGILNVHDDGTIDIVGGTLHINGTEVLNGSNSAIFTGLTVDSPTLVVDAVNNRVGIGTTSPTNRLDVEIQTTDAVPGSVLNSDPIADFVNRGSSGAIRGLQIGAPTGSITGPVYLKVNGTGNRFGIVDQSNTENFTILDNGNVGIGTTNPIAKLHVLDVNSPSILVQDTTNNVQTYISSIDLVGIVGTGTAHDLILRTNNADRMRITASGLVGIGTTALSAGATGQLAVGSSRQVSINGNSGLVSINASSGGWAMQYGFNGSAGTNHGGFGAFGNTDVLTYHWIGASHLATTAVFTAAGNVGIGTNNPSQKLHVVGTVLATAFSGPLTGNATTATTLQTARTINGTSFNGSANITTANWGTARTIWGQSINGAVNITGPVRPAAGSVSAPAFSTSGDTNTGMFFPGGDTIAFTEGGVEAMRITPTGNVGIGTSSPAGRLEVSAGTNLNAVFKQLSMDNASNGGIGIEFSRTTSNAMLSAIGITDSDKLTLASRNGIHFYTGGTVGYPQTTERMRIDASGNLLVGRTSVLNNGTISVTGVSKQAITAIVTNNVNSLFQGFNSSAAVVFQVTGNGTVQHSSTVYPFSDAAVDIGTSSTRYRNIYVSGAISNSDVNGPLILAAGNAEHVRISSTGNVGIGTNNPVSKLDVNGTVTADGLVVDASEASILGGSSTSGSDTTLIIGSGTNTAHSTHGIQFRDRYGTAGFPDGQISAFIQAERASTAADFDLVLGTTTNIALDAVQRLRISDDGDISFYEDTGTTPRFFWDASAERLGLGTTNPLGVLDVQDNRSSLSATQDITAEFHRADGTLSPRFQIRHSTAGTDLNHTYSTSANSFTFSNAGIERMRIDSAGNVGIGVVPSAKLEVLGSSNSNYLRLSGDDAAGARGLDFTSFTVNANAGAGHQINAKSIHGTLTFATSNTERLRITNTGNVGIGTNNPTVPLDVVGNANISGNIVIGGNLTINGTVTTINTETINLADNIITLNSNYTGSAPTENSGIEVERGTLTNVVLQWNETNDHWEIASGGTTGRILTVNDEGSGNGLDADSVDGLQASQFLRSDANDTVTGLITTNRSGEHMRFADTSATGSPFIAFAQGATRRGFIQYLNGGTIRLGSDVTGERLDIGSGLTGLKFFENVTNVAHTVWHAGNDGPGSGLDADLLDGVQAASFLRSDAADTYGSTLTITGVVRSTNNNNVDGPNFNVSTTNKSTVEYAYRVDRSGTVVGGIQIDGKGVFASGTTINGNTVWHAGNDGSGSGLDADTVDGIQASQFLRSDAVDILDAGNNANPLVIRRSGASAAQVGIQFDVPGTHNRFFGIGTDGNPYWSTTADLTGAGFEIWHAGNDGAGSGLDADSVDGLQASQFLRSDTSGTLTGALTITSDLTIADRIIHLGDTNTQIRFPAADTVSVETNGVERLRVNSAGDLLIGGTGSNIYSQTSGNGQFEYGRDTGTVRGSLMLSNNAARGWSTVYMNKFNRPTGSDRRYIDWYLNGNTIAKIYVNAAGNGVEYETSDGTGLFGLGSNTVGVITNSTERLRIDSSGNLLVGKTSIAFSAVGVRASPAGEIQGTVSGGTSLFLNRTTTDGEIAAFYKNGTKVGNISVESGDNFSISAMTGGGAGLMFWGAGGTAPLITPRTEDVNSDAEVDIGRSANRFKDLYLSGTAFVDTAVRFSTNVTTPIGNTVFRPASNTIAIGTNSTERLRITSAGNVGIGVSSPVRVLDLGSGTNGNGIAWGGASGTANFTNIYSSRSGGELTLATMLRGSLSVNNGFESSNGGNFGKSAVQIGYGDVKFFTNAASAVATGTAFTPTERLRITSTGNVGIGTVAPSSKFEVVGTAGQLFSVSDSTSGTIFSVSDASGIPSIEADDTGQVRLAEFSGNVLIGTSIDDNSNKLQVNGGIMATADITAYASSDERLKTDLQPIDNALEKVNSLTGYTFNWNELARGKNSDEREAGVIAQDVEKVLPEVTTTRDDGYMAVKYEKLVPLLIEAIKELTAEIEALKKDR